MTVAVPLVVAHRARAPAARIVPTAELDRGLAAALDALSLACDQPSHAPLLVAAQADGGLRPDARRDFAWAVAPGGAAAAPLFTTDEPLWHLLAGDGVLRASAEVARRMPVRARSVVIGTPLCERGEPLLAPGASLPRELPGLLDAVTGHARAVGALGVFWKDVPAGGDLDRALDAAGFAAFVSLPTARIDLRGLGDLDGYLRWLAGVASAGDLRRKLRDAGLVTEGVRLHLARRHGAAGASREEARWRARADAVAARHLARGLVLPPGARPPLRITRESSPSPELIASLMPLYAARLATAALRWETLTPRFFTQLVADPSAQLVVAWLGAVPVGFSIGLRRGGSWLCLRSGVHPTLARPFSVSMLLVLADLEHALAGGCDTLLLGPTAYATKARFGARFEPTVARMRLVGAARVATRAVAAVIDRANRRAGVHRLHEAIAHDDWTPRAPRGERGA